MKFGPSAFRRALRPNYVDNKSVFSALNEFHDRSVILVRIFYTVSITYSYMMINRLSYRDPNLANFLWPVSWMDLWQLRHYMAAVGIGLFLVNLALVIGHNSRVLRVLFFVLALFSAALDLSFGVTSHPWHMWIWISFILIFLPNPKTMGVRAFKLSTVSTIVYVQALLLLFYTMAGFGKLKAGLIALIAGTSGNFSPTGFASLLADRMLQGHGQTILGWVFIDWPYLGFVPFTVLIILQTVSVFIAFTPGLHRIWGIILVLFHFGTALLMSIYFPTHVAWMVIFFIFSPFYTGYGYRLKDDD